MAIQTRMNDRELLSEDNLTCIIRVALRDLVGCGCENWHYMRLWQHEDGCYYTGGIELGRGISPSYPASPFEDGGIDPRQITLTLPCCDCHDVSLCDCKPDDCPCVNCGCLCHDDERAYGLAQQAMGSLREDAD